VACPDRLLLHHNGRGFEVRVDASELPEVCVRACVHGRGGRVHVFLYFAASRAAVRFASC
jgi:hypothetical protein